MIVPAETQRTSPKRRPVSLHVALVLLLLSTAPFVIGGLALASRIGTWADHNYLRGPVAIFFAIGIAYVVLGVLYGILSVVACIGRRNWARVTIAVMTAVLDIWLAYEVFGTAYALLTGYTGYDYFGGQLWWAAWRPGVLVSSAAGAVLMYVRPSNRFFASSTG